MTASKPLLWLDQALLRLGCFSQYFRESAEKEREVRLAQVINLATYSDQSQARLVTRRRCPSVAEALSVSDAERGIARTLILHHLQAGRRAALMRNLAHDQHVEQLCFFHIEVTLADVFALANGLANNDALRSLVLVDCALGPRDMRILVQQGMLSPRSRSRLEAFTSVGNEIGAQGALAISRVHTLKRVTLVDASLGIAGVDYLFSALQATKNQWEQLVLHNENKDADLNADDTSKKHKSSTLGPLLRASSSKLQKLDLQRSHHIVNLDAVIAGLRRNSTLRALNLSGNQISLSMARRLARALQPNDQGTWASSLEELHLVQTTVCSNGIVAICHGLQHNTKLRLLDWSGPHTAFDCNSACAALATALFHNKTLQELALNDVRNSTHLLTTLANASGHCSEAPACGRPTFGGLQALYFRNNMLTESEARTKALVPSDRIFPSVGLFGIISTLTSLDLSYCWNLGPLGAASLAHGLARNPNALRYLSLSHCRILDDGAIALGSALNEPYFLVRHLDLEANGIGVVGSRALATGLQNNTSLSVLSLAFNDDDDDGMGAEGLIQFRNVLRDFNRTVRFIFVSTHHTALQQEIQYYGYINFAGRRHVICPNLPISLWPWIFQRTNRNLDMIRFLVHTKPELFHPTGTGPDRRSSIVSSASSSSPEKQSLQQQTKRIWEGQEKSKSLAKRPKRVRF